jgi:NodT family efflux transporter outer membrane factor (OMF) lipoprotein
MRLSWSQRWLSSSRVRGVVAIPLGIGLSTLLGGCFVGTEKPDAALDVPKTYRHAPRNPNAALPAVDWWRGFRSRQLTALVEEGLTSNLDIAAAVARIIQTDAQSRIAGAALLPVADLDASVTRSRPSQGTGTGAGGASERTTYSASISASYEIDFWGKNRAALRAAEQGAAAARFEREVISITTAATIANTYFLVLSSQERLRVARDNLAAASRVFNLVQERFNAGTASALDTAQQESVVATVRAALPLLEQAVRENIAILASLIARPPAHVWIGSGGGINQIAIPPVTPGLPSDLLGQRPDIRQAEALLEGANASVHAARAAMFPSITLTGEGGFQSAALRTLLRPESAFFNLTAGLTQPILDGLRLQGQLDFEKGRQDELLQLYRRAVVNAFTDVERALIAVQQTTERERLQREVVRSSRQAFEISETRLREGAVDLITVLNTQQTLFQADDALIQARLARLQALVSLFQALGGGWPPPRNDGVAVAVSSKG